MRNKGKKSRILVVLLLFLLPLTSPVQAAQAHQEMTAINLTVTGEPRYDYAEEVLELLNQERAAVGQAALVMDQTLLDCAMQRAAELSVLFDHTRPDGTRALDMAANAWGENIAYGYKSPQGVNEGWMNSEGHRKNMLQARYTGVGIGCFDQGGVLYWVQLFGELETPARQIQGSTGQTQTNVSAQAESLDLSVQPIEGLFVGETRAVVALAGKTPLGSGDYTLESSNPAVARVNSDGTVTGVGSGSADITVKVGSNAAKSTAQVVFFQDVAAGSQNYAAVRDCYLNGWMKGTSATEFGADKPLSRDMAVVVLYRMAGEPATTYSGNFTDVLAGQWYSDAISWACQNGIVTGYSESYFNRTDNLTREQVVSIMHRYARYAGQDTSADAALSYQDAGSVSDWAQEPMRWAQKRGLLSRLTNTDTLSPGAAVTRAQCAELLVQMANR